MILAVGSLSISFGPAIAGLLAARSLSASDRGDLAIILAAVAIAGVVAARGLDVSLLSSIRTLDLDTNLGVVRRHLSLRSLKGLRAEAPIAALVAYLIVTPVEKYGVAGAIALVAMSMILTSLSCDFLTHRALRLARGQMTSVFATDVSSGVCHVVLAALIFSSGGSTVTFLLATTISLAVPLVIERWTSPSQPPSQASLEDVHNALAPLGTSALKSRMLMIAAFRLDRILLGAFAGTAPVGVYAVAVPLGEAAAVVPNHLANLVNLRASTGDQTPWYRQRPALIGLMSTAAIALPSFVFARPLVTTLFGERYEDAVTPLRLLCVASLVGAVWRLSEAELFGRNLPQATVRASLAAAAAVVVLTAALARGLGASAPALASLVGYFLAALFCAVSLRGARQ